MDFCYIKKGSDSCFFKIICFILSDEVVFPRLRLCILFMNVRQYCICMNLRERVRCLHIYMQEMCNVIFLW